LKLSDLQAIFADNMLSFAKNHFPTQNLLSDAESNICKYNPLIDNDITLFWKDKSYAGGRLWNRKWQESANDVAAQKRKSKHLKI